ncbi:hypothetical protein ACHWQZ_G019257 [Mnemiopsis leidyi]
MALAAETLDELVTSDLKSEWLVAKSHWFPRSDTAENAAYDKRTPGLFKIEWSGGGFVGLAAKTYFCFNPDNRQKEKCSTKGINKAAKISIDHFRSVLHTKQSVSSTNRGFILKDNNMLSYAMERSGLSYFYCKRKDSTSSSVTHLAERAETSRDQTSDTDTEASHGRESTLNNKSSHPRVKNTVDEYDMDDNMENDTKASVVIPSSSDDDIQTNDSMSNSDIASDISSNRSSEPVSEKYLQLLHNKRKANDDSKVVSLLTSIESALKSQSCKEEGLKCFDFLFCYTMKKHFFAELDSWLFVELGKNITDVLTQEEQYFVDAVIATSNLSNLHRLMNENSTMVKSILDQFATEKKEKQRKRRI